jgi:autotransporter-associated beta strand protein
MALCTRIGGGLNSTRSHSHKQGARRAETGDRRLRKLQLLSVTACAIAGLLSKSAIAASGSWTGATDGSWSDANWTASPPPGISDTATFNGAGGVSTTIDLGSGITVGNILFNSPLAAAYTIGNGSIGSQTLSLNGSGGIVINPTVVNAETFNAAIVLGTNDTAQTYTFTNNSLNSGLYFSGNISGGPVGGTVGYETLNVNGAGNTTISGSLLNGNASSISLTKTGSGTLTFNGTTNAALLGSGQTGGAFGTVTINAGTLALDFSNYNASGNANLLNSFSPVSLGGGTLQIIGNATNASTQSFNNGSGVTANPGMNVVSVGPNGGNIANPLPTMNLGAFTQNVGSMTVFNGPAYYNSATGASAVTVPATGTITTTTLGNQNNLLWPTSRVAVATVGLYNWASVVTTGTGAHNILSGDQVSGFYTQEATGNLPASDQNLDITGNVAGKTTATTAYNDTWRFNTAANITVAGVNNDGTNNLLELGGILVTPNVAAHNITINGRSDGTTGDYGYMGAAAASGAIDVYQNNTSGYLGLNTVLYQSTTTMSYVQGGVGTVVMAPITAGTDWTGAGAVYLNGGNLVIPSGYNLGDGNTGGVILNGGTLVGATVSAADVVTGGATVTADSTAARAFTLLSNGGGLAAVSGGTLTIDGRITSAAGTGPLVIGIPASAANGNVAGLLPGTGSGTANTTPVYATGTVALTYANGTNGNTQYGGTIILGGATLNINSQYDLGGADQGPTTFNNGTLQYATTLATGAAGTALDISAQPVIFAGNATIDTNGHAVTYANSIGNGGSGLLTVKSNATGGVLTLAAANTYTGGTNVSSGTLNVTNTIGSATGTGPVNLLGGTLTGGGFISGAVNASGSTITPGAAGTVLTLGSFTYNAGSLNFSINGSTGTASQISTGTAVFNATPTFGALSLSGATSITSGQRFTVLSSTSLSGSLSFPSSANQSIGRYTFTPAESGNSIVFNVSGNPANLVWAAGVSGLGTGTAPQGDGFTWNNTQSTGASNWNNGGNYDYFYSLDSVTFNDTGSPSHAVIITTPVSPSSVTVNTAGTYIFTSTGSGAITGVGTLTVAAGVLDLGLAGNTYSGGTNISSGAILTTGAAGALPSTGTVTVAGTLDLDGYNQSIGGLSGGGVTTGIVQSTGGAATLTTNTTGTSSFGGTLQNGSGTLALTVAGTGTEILTGSNTYTGLTTINSGATLQIGNNTATYALPANQVVTDNGNLSFNFSAGTYSVTSNISGSGTVTQSSPAGTILQMGSNSYTGGTIIKSGTIQLTNATGLGTGDVTIASGSLLNINGISPTLGALNGAGIIDSTTAGTMVLTIGNNNDGGTFSGTIQNSNGTTSLVKAGSGTQVLSGVNTFAGTTTLNGGTLSISGTLGSSSNSTGAIYVNTATLNISGSVYAPSLSTYNTAGYSAMNLTAGNVTLTGNLGVNVDTNGSGDSSLVSLTGGTLSANTVTIDRSNTNYGSTPQVIGSSGTGLYVNGATLTIASTLTLGDLSRSLSSADMRIDSGSVTVGGTTVITDNNTRLSLLDVNGGTFTSNDTTGAGIQVGGLYTTGYGELLVSGTGTLNTNLITLGDGNQTAGLNILELVGGKSYIGSGGIVAGAGTATDTINLGSTAVATAPIIAASASWSSSLAMALSNSSSGSGSLLPTFQAANASGGAENITLNGVLNGTGGFNKTGSGYVYLGYPHYTGPTVVSAGTLVDPNNYVLQLGLSSALNINGNMIIQSNPSLQTITQEVAEGYNGGNWNGSSKSAGLPITSSSAASDSTHLHALGVIQNDTTGGAGGGTQMYSTFEGYSSLNDSDVLIKYTYYGDTDLNGQVDGSDYARIDNGYLNGLSGWFNGDFNYDNVVDGSDYTLMDNAYNTQGAQISSIIASPDAVATDQIAGATIGATSAVPEPASLGLLGIGAVGLLGRRRRRR